MPGTVVAVSCSDEHGFSKPNADSIELVAGLGVAGDAHSGKKVKHLFLARKDPDAPNLRQVHLIHQELFDELRTQGFDVNPGQVGDNLTTRGIDLLGLPTGTLLRTREACIEITGLRTPCHQLDTFQAGLLKAVVETAPDGAKIFKSGVMGIVIGGGTIRPGDAIDVELPAEPHTPLVPV